MNAEFAHTHLILSLSNDVSESRTAPSDESSAKRFQLWRFLAYGSFDRLRMRRVRVE
jgi:hypothetical protein